MTIPAPLIPPLYAHDPVLLVQHALAQRWLDPVMIASSVACQGWVLIAIVVAVAVFPERANPRAPLVAAIALLTLAVDGAAVHMVKHAFNVPRPLAVLGPDAVRVLIEPLRARSMPSGHASAAAMLGAFAVRRHGRAGAPFAVFAVLGGISRIYVGAHWVEDVVAGWMIGIPIGLAGGSCAARAAVGGLRALLPRSLRTPEAVRATAATPPSGPQRGSAAGDAPGDGSQT